MRRSTSGKWMTIMPYKGREDTSAEVICKSPRNRTKVAEVPETTTGGVWRVEVGESRAPGSVIGLVYERMHP